MVKNNISHRRQMRHGLKNSRSIDGVQFERREFLLSQSVVLVQDTFFDEILNKAPLSPLRLNSKVPAGLEEIINKALEKDRRVRYQSAKDLVVDLQRLKRDLEPGAPARDQVPGAARPRRWAAVQNGWLVAGVAAAVVLLVVLVFLRPHNSPGADSSEHIESLAVLPFTNVNADPETEYLSDGLTENLIDGLSQLPKLRVMAPSTVLGYKGVTVDPRKAGRDLKVGAVLSGRVAEVGSRLIIHVSLIDVATRSQLWTQQYNCRLSDIVTTEKAILKETAEKLRLGLTAEEQKRLARSYPPNSEAYLLYLKGRYYWNRGTAEDRRKGVMYLEQVVEKDPNFAPANAGTLESAALPKSGAAEAEVAAESQSPGSPPEIREKASQNQKKVRP